MKKRFIAILLFSLNGVLFAQTDYFFLVEKPASTGNLIVLAYQTLVASLVTDIDTVSAVTYSGVSTFLFASMPGNLPNLVGLVAANLLQDAAQEAVSSAGFAEALALADEQAAVWGRPEADKKLIIITGAATSGKIKSPSAPQAFSNIYYLSLDSLPEQGIADIATTAYTWAIDSENPQPIDPQFVVSLADGLFNCIKAIASKYKKITPAEDFAAFSVGNFLFHVRKAVVLAYHNGTDPVKLLKNEQTAQDASIYPQSDWTVMRISGNGNYTIENGEAALIVAEMEVSAFVLTVLIFIAIAIIVILLIIIVVVLKKAGKIGDVVFEIAVLRSSQDICPRKPQVCIKKKNDDPMFFESGAKFKDMFEIMGVNFPSKELSNVVEKEFPQILFEKKKWLIKFNPNHIRKVPVGEGKKKVDITGISLDGSDSDSQTEEKSGQEEIITLESDTIIVNFDAKKQFEVKNIFKKNAAYKLFLKKAP